MSAAKDQRRQVRLAERRKVYTHRPPSGQPAERKRRRPGIFIPIPGKTIHDENMGSKLIHIGGLSTHRPSTKSRKRRDPARWARKLKLRRRRRARALSYAIAAINKRDCERGAHEWQTITLADRRTYRRCIRGCGKETAPR